MKNITYNKDGSVRKSGSGRKKGAKSFVNTTLAELEKFCGSAAQIPVSRVWIEKMGAIICEPELEEIITYGDKKLKEMMQSHKEKEAEEKISFVLHQ